MLVGKQRCWGPMLWPVPRGSSYVAPRGSWAYRRILFFYDEFPFVYVAVSAALFFGVFFCFFLFFLGGGVVVCVCVCCCCCCFGEGGSFFFLFSFSCHPSITRTVWTTWQIKLFSPGPAKDCWAWSARGFHWPISLHQLLTSTNSLDTSAGCAQLSCSLGSRGTGKGTMAPFCCCIMSLVVSLLCPEQNLSSPTWYCRLRMWWLSFSVLGFMVILVTVFFSESAAVHLSTKMSWAPDECHATRPRSWCGTRYGYVYKNR